MAAQAERVAAAFLEAAEKGISRRRIAIAALGEGASKQRVDNLKNQFVKWIGGYNGPSDDSARLLARGFGKVGLPEYDAGYFMKPRANRPPAERPLTRAEYQAEIERLRQEREEDKKREDQRYRRLQAEIRKIREAS